MLLDGSPVIAATESMRKKLEAEYATVEEDLLDKFPEVCCASGEGARHGDLFCAFFVSLQPFFVCVCVFRIFVW